MANSNTAPLDEAPPPEPAGDELPPEQEERIVTKTVNAVTAHLRELVNDIVGTAGKSEPPDGEPEGDDSPSEPEPSTPRQLEALSEDAVRQAVDKINADKEHAEHHAHLREAERPPQQFSRLTKALWGDR